jgi:hypothetical protein
MSDLKMKYFVLKPKSKNSDDLYAQASRKAMRAYANHIYFKDPEFANQIRAWVDNESAAELEMKEVNGTLPQISTMEDGR